MEIGKRNLGSRSPTWRNWPLTNKNAKKIHTRKFKCCPYGNKRTQNTSHRILTSPAIIQHKKDKLATKQRVEEEKLRKRTEKEEKKKAREQDKAKKSIKGRGPQPKGKK